MKAIKLLFILAFLGTSLNGQEKVISVPDNLITEGIPSISSDLINEVKNYTESRGASLAAWHPTRKEMLILTRFTSSNQLHYVKFPGGSRKQLTFFDEPVASATFEPTKGEYILFLKDIGGNEFTQIYCYDLDNKRITQLTGEERSQNGDIIWSNKGDRIAYTSTKRNGRDRDVYIMDPLNPASERRVSVNDGGGWTVVDWSSDESELLLQEVISVNESRLYLVDIQGGSKVRLIPEQNERSTYRGVGFSKDGRGIYMITNKDNEYNKLAFYELSTKKINIFVPDIQWDVEFAELSSDGSRIAFVTNENGISKLYELITSGNKSVRKQGLPTGIIRGIQWYGDSRSLGITFTSYNSSVDIFEYDCTTNKIIRWTESEPGGMDLSDLNEPQLIKWKSFDGEMISGYLYQASSEYSGKRPVIINIHGGPEGQYRPGFIGNLNYFLKESGISIIYPNVRGSTGYGKTFADMDNGIKRMESVKDIGALIDWIVQQPYLDGDRIMVTGGSYGGFMTLAVSYMYSDKIRCSLDLVGISNFNTFLKNTESYRRDLRRAEYGDERDAKMAEYFEAIAPVNHVEKIKKPIFIVQGGNDPRVPYTESIQMKEKIKENNGTVWFLMARDEGHGFRKKNNIDFQYYSTIAFIKQFLLE